jgi:hypothetical protein
MNAKDLARRLKTLRRTVLMLETELRQGRMDKELLAAIEQQLEDGIASEPRSMVLRSFVDALRENTLTPRAELLADTIRASAKLGDAIQGVLDNLH